MIYIVIENDFPHETVQSHTVSTKLVKVI